MASSRCERLLHSQLRVCKFQSACALCDGLIYQSMDLMAIGSKDIVLAAGKVGMYLSREERILRDICPPRVFVQGEYQEPSYANDYAERGKVRR